MPENWCALKNNIFSAPEEKGETPDLGVDHHQTPPGLSRPHQIQAVAKHAGKCLILLHC